MSFDRLLVLAVPALVVLSCSVKENRSACPCTLLLEMYDLPVTPVVLNVEGEGYAHTQIVHADTVLALAVPKGVMSVSAVGGTLPDGDGCVRIPEGEQAPRLMLFHADVPTETEQVTLPVLLRKQFCSLELVFSGPPGFGPPFEVEVEGTVDGWFRDGRPSSGAFSFRLSPGEDGRCTVRLPRQEDDSLLMHVVFADEVIRTFALGTYIAASGYDWSAPDLDDVTLHVDISFTSVTLSTDLWTQTEEIELWI